MGVPQPPLGHLVSTPCQHTVSMALHLIHTAEMTLVQRKLPLPSYRPHSDSLTSSITYLNVRKHSVSTNTALYIGPV